MEDGGGGAGRLADFVAALELLAVAEGVGHGEVETGVIGGVEDGAVLLV